MPEDIRAATDVGALGGCTPVTSINSPVCEDGLHGPFDFFVAPAVADKARWAM
jgi:hypothetical protein